jgi:hypothetical protein
MDNNILRFTPNKDIVDYADPMSDEDDRVEGVDHEMTDEIVCPHCGFIYDGSDLFDEDTDIITCESCQKLFGYEREIEVAYTTWKEDEDENPE